MTLTLHNTLTKKTEAFVSQKPGYVSLYTCGPTVYDSQTVGNWTAYIYWDTLVRTLRANEYTVERVLNITDVGHLVSDADEGEDKLEKGARREGKTAWDIAKAYTDVFFDGMKKLGLIMPEHIAPATDFIPEQLALVRKLKEKGFTYQISDGIYFDSSKFPTYANFAKLDLTQQKAGARVEFNPEKRHASDFALWKFTKGATRDMQWQTPDDLLEGGTKEVMGFPGWHLECSAIAMHFLGDTLDIHTGGIDHIPVHHTNEIAQSEAATGKQFAHFWLHNDHLKVDGTKISKSLGNGYTLAQLAERGFEALDFRVFILQGHYRGEGNFTFDNLTAAKNRRHHWRNVAALRWQIHDTLQSDKEKRNEDKTIQLFATPQALLETLNDDLNTPAAFALLDKVFNRIQIATLTTIHRPSLISLLETADELLGLQLLETTPDIRDEQKQRILERQQAREAQDWQASDQIRDELLGQGIVIRDTQNGSIWEYAQ